MQKFANVEVAFIHRLEPLPSEFAYPPMPETLNARQAQKWQSRRAAHFLLTKLFAQNGVDSALLQQIQRTASGRPFVDSPNLDFNISHSGDWIAVIFSQCFANERLAVGIDIEHPQKQRRFEALIRHYGNVEEQQALLAEPSPMGATLETRFYLSWCLREAVLKSQGVGIVKLAEVAHFPLEKRIASAHCPAGWLHFSAELPFYLSYFYQQPQNVLLSEPKIRQWRAGHFQPINVPSVRYAVNTRSEK